MLQQLFQFLFPDDDDGDESWSLAMPEKYLSLALSSVSFDLFRDSGWLKTSRSELIVVLKK